MPSASRQLPRLAVAACASAFLLGTAAGCSTTQEKAAQHQAEAKRILEARAERQQRKKNEGHGGKDDRPHENGGKQ